MPTINWRLITIGWLVNRHFGWPHTLESRRQRQLNLDPQKIREVEEYRAQLEALDQADLAALYAEEKRKSDEEEEAKARETAERRARELAQREAAYPYNAPADAGTYDYWSKASFWTIDEAIMLACGRRPENFDKDTLKQNRSVSSFAGEYARLKELARRAVAMQQLYDPVLPTLFLAWARRLELRVEPALVAAIEARGLQIADWKDLYEKQVKITATYQETVETQDRTIAALRETLEIKATALPPPEKGLATRERESLLKMLIGMALKGYAYDPNLPRNTATAEIAEDLNSIGIGLDPDTVRKWLKEAADLLPRDDRTDQ